MIHFALKCTSDHRFESWFQSSEAFDKLLAAGHVACTVCGSTEVEKALMAPRVQKGGRPAEGDRPLGQPRGEAEQALAELRRRVEENADYVGDRFAAEARAMHLGDTPDRPIYGETRPEEARALLEDGVPVMPLPFAPKRKTN